MTTNVLCGKCGATLGSPAATCSRCGSRPGGVRPLPRPKNRWLAVALAALLPGLGHIYLGHFRKGLFYLAAAGGLEFLGFDLDLTGIGAALGIPMGLGGLGLWAHGIWDVYHLARRQA